MEGLLSTGPTPSSFSTHSFHISGFLSLQWVASQYLLVHLPLHCLLQGSLLQPPVPIGSVSQTQRGKLSPIGQTRYLHRSDINLVTFSHCTGWRRLKEKCDTLHFASLPLQMCYLMGAHLPAKAILHGHSDLFVIKVEVSCQVCKIYLNRGRIFVCPVY